MSGSLILSWKVGAPYELHDWYDIGLQKVFLGEQQAYMWLQQHSVSILLIATAYLFVIDGGTALVRGMLDKFPILYANAIASLRQNDHQSEQVLNARKSEDDQNKDIEEENAGEWIGILERLTTLTFVLTGSFTAIAFALTAKSIARFKELEDKSFAEYYLLGTSASLIVALCGRNAYPNNSGDVRWNLDKRKIPP